MRVSSGSITDAPTPARARRACRARRRRRGSSAAAAAPCRELPRHHHLRQQFLGRYREVAQRHHRHRRGAQRDRQLAVRRDRGARAAGRAARGRIVPQGDAADRRAAGGARGEDHRSHAARGLRGRHQLGGVPRRQHPGRGRGGAARHQPRQHRTAVHADRASCRTAPSTLVPRSLPRSARPLPWPPGRERPAASSASRCRPATSRRCWRSSRPRVPSTCSPARAWRPSTTRRRC